jgi:hypothetical protein
MTLQMLGLVAAATVLVGGTAQLAPPPAQAVAYVAHMDGAQDTPPLKVPGKGTATLTLTGNKLTYVITVDSLSGEASAAHIHIGKVGASGPPVVTFKLMKIGTSGKLASGEADLTKDVNGISGDSLKVLLRTGGAYVNVHTAAHAGGEIRGQILKK